MTDSLFSSLKRRRPVQDPGDEDRGFKEESKEEAVECPNCMREVHDGCCQPICPSCDRPHLGKCTAFCRMCAGIGHRFDHCSRFKGLPFSQRKSRRGRGHSYGHGHGGRKQGGLNVHVDHGHGGHNQKALNVHVDRVQINVPLINEYPITSAAELNKAILEQVKTALEDLPGQGVPLPARVFMSNVTITTPLMPRGVATMAMEHDTLMSNRARLEYLLSLHRENQRPDVTTRRTDQYL